MLTRLAAALIVLLAAVPARAEITWVCPWREVSHSLHGQKAPHDWFHVHGSFCACLDRIEILGVEHPEQPIPYCLDIALAEDKRAYRIEHHTNPCPKGEIPVGTVEGGHDGEYDETTGCEKAPQ